MKKTFTALAAVLGLTMLLGACGSPTTDSTPVSPETVSPIPTDSPTGIPTASPTVTPTTSPTVTPTTSP